MLIILLTGLFYKKAYEKILSLGCLVVLTVPFFSYLLNGALYVRPKSLIPFFAAYVLSYGKISGEAEKSENRENLDASAMSGGCYIYLSEEG